MKIAEALEISLDKITGQFETGGNWKRLTANFDRRGPSLGILQFSFGAGGLQPLLNYVERRAGLQTFFRPEDYAEIKSIMRCSIDYQRDFVNKNWFIRGGWNPQREALEFGFQALARSRDFREAQIVGSKKYADKATALFKQYNFQTFRAWAIFFDIAVQNGGVRTSTKAEIQLLRGETEKTLRRKMTNIERLRNWIRIRASKSRPEYRADVLARKLAILNDGGLVHRKQYDFSGLCLDRHISDA